MTTVDPRYPIGPWNPPASVDAALLGAWIDDLAALPADFRRVVEAVGESRLDTPYRPGGWTVRQVVHHVPDSHLNGYVRMKWALTETAPTIKTYEQDEWATLPDTAATDVQVSLALLDALHRRWATLLRALGADDVAREYVNPESGPLRLDVAIGLYAWHGRHHLAHIRTLAEREGWI